MPEFGEVKAVALRDVWPSEPRDFTPWLAENIERLSEALGMDLEVATTEAEVGNFSLDLLAKDLGSGRHVAIENQFGPTDHDHLGKLITYAAGLDAGAAIWISETVREEHRQSLEWLNRRTDTDTHFFAVEVEVFRVDTSRPAVRFKTVVYPNEWQRAARASAERQPSPRAEAYRHYFQILIDDLREKHGFTRARAGQPQNWYVFPSGTQGVVYGTSFAQGGRVRVELYIDRGDADQNKTLFDRFFTERSAIEQELGEPLEWEPLDDRRACRIAIYRNGSIEEPESKLVEIRQWAIDHLLLLKRVLGPRLKRLST